MQVEIERRYAAVLHHTVKRMMEGIIRIAVQVLAQPPSEDRPSSAMAAPIVRSCSPLREISLYALLCSAGLCNSIGLDAASSPKLETCTNSQASCIPSWMALMPRGRYDVDPALQTKTTKFCYCWEKPKSDVPSITTQRVSP